MQHGVYQKGRGKLKSLLLYSDDKSITHKHINYLLVESFRLQQSSENSYVITWVYHNLVRWKCVGKISNTCCSTLCLLLLWSNSLAMKFHVSNQLLWCTSFVIYLPSTVANHTYTRSWLILSNCKMHLSAHTQVYSCLFLPRFSNPFTGINFATFSFFVELQIIQ